MKVVTKDEFTKILIEQLVHDKRDWNTREIYEELVSGGFPKLDFDRLGASLSKMFVYLPTMVVDFGDTKFVWVVSGTDAMLVNKEQK